MNLSNTFILEESTSIKNATIVSQSKLYPLSIADDSQIAISSLKTSCLRLEIHSSGKSERLNFSTGALYLKKSRSAAFRFPVISEFKLNDSEADNQCDEEVCRICLDSSPKDDLVSPCACKGSSKHVHSECLKVWIMKSGKTLTNISFCEVCKEHFSMKFKYRVNIGLCTEDSFRFWLPFTIALFMLAGILCFYFNGLIQKSPEGVVVMSVCAIFGIIGVLSLFLALSKAKSSFCVRDVVDWKILTRDN